jgi:phosphatidylglycerol:prolipoprotein diacylglycerol transferase
MKPVAFMLGDHPIHYYGIFYAFGILVLWLVMRSEFKRLGQPTDRAYDLTLGIVVVSFVGAKLVFVGTQIARGRGPESWHLLSGQGMVVAGGLAGNLLFAWWYARYRKLPLGQVLDIGILGGTPGVAVGRMGCLMTGCCYGRPSDLPWAVTFTDPLTVAPRGVPLHPTQVYDALTLLLIFAVLWTLRRRKRFEGQLVVLGLGAFAVARPLLELFRGDAARGLYLGGRFSTSQILALPVLVLAVVLYRRLSRGRG